MSTHQDQVMVHDGGHILDSDHGPARTDGKFWQAVKEYCGKDGVTQEAIPCTFREEGYGRMAGAYLIGHFIRFFGMNYTTKRTGF
jgi:hypothetical protein